MRKTAWRGVVAAAALAAAAALRFGVVEPASIVHLCNAPAAPWWCTLRAAVVALYTSGALGIGAVGAGALATFTRSCAWALLAVCLGAAGLVLYAFDAGAVGFLLGALVLARSGSTEAGRGAPGKRDA